MESIAIEQLSTAVSGWTRKTQHRLHWRIRINLEVWFSACMRVPQHTSHASQKSIIISKTLFSIEGFSLESFPTSRQYLSNHKTSCCHMRERSLGAFNSIFQTESNFSIGICCWSWFFLDLSLSCLFIIFWKLFQLSLVWGLCQ